MRTGHYESSEGSHVGTAVTLLLIGLGAGALAGLLLAPKTGKQMRKYLQRGYEDAKENFDEWAEEAKDRAKEMGDRIRDVAAREVEMAEDLREKTEPIRKAIRRS